MSHRASALATAAAATATIFAVAAVAPASAAPSSGPPAPGATVRGLLDLVTTLPVALPVPPPVPLPLVGGTPSPLPTTPPAVPLPIPLPPSGALPLGGDLLAPLQGLVGTLGTQPPGTAPTGGQLGPVTNLLRQLAAMPGLDSTVGATLTQLADQIDAQGGALPTGLLGTLGTTLQSIAATPGVPAPVQAAVKSIATLLGASSGAPAPGPTPKPPAPKPPAAGTPPGGTSPSAGRPAIGRVRISSVRVDRKRGTVLVAIRCPTGPTCKTLLGVTRGGSLQSSTGVLTIPAGTTAKQALKLTTSSRRLIKRKTTTFVVGALLPDGKVATRTATAKAPKVRARKAKA